MRSLMVVASVSLALTGLACECTMPVYDSQRVVSADIVW